METHTYQPTHTYTPDEGNGRTEGVLEQSEELFSTSSPAILEDIVSEVEQNEPPFCISCRDNGQYILTCPSWHTSSSPFLNSSSQVETDVFALLLWCIIHSDSVSMLSWDRDSLSNFSVNVWIE